MVANCDYPTLTITYAPPPPHLLLFYCIASWRKDDNLQEWDYCFECGGDGYQYWWGESDDPDGYPPCPWCGGSGKHPRGYSIKEEMLR